MFINFVVHSCAQMKQCHSLDKHPALTSILSGSFPSLSIPLIVQFLLTGQLNVCITLTSSCCLMVRCGGCVCVFPVGYILMHSLERERRLQKINFVAEKLYIVDKASFPFVPPFTKQDLSKKCCHGRLKA